MRSSGVLAYGVEQERQCVGNTYELRFPLWEKDDRKKFTVEVECTFVGEVEVVVDPESRVKEWVCPVCRWVHSEEWEVEADV